MHTLVPALALLAASAACALLLAGAGVAATKESNVRCCHGDENRPFALACPPGTNVTAIDFASYGTPAGYCGQWALGACHADVSTTLLSVCGGLAYCELLPSDSFFGVDSCPGVATKKLAVQWRCGGQVRRVRHPLPGTPPLSTNGRYIVDSYGQRVKLAGVNWYGAHCYDFVPGGLHVNHVRDIARSIREAGFNVVRLQWSNQIVRDNPFVEPIYVAANPQLLGLRALDVYTVVVEALGEEGLFVIIDNHVSDAGWCCSLSDGNGLWFNRNYTEETFFQHWEYMVDRYSSYPHVIGAELRNELRPSCGNDDDDGTPLCRSATWDGPEMVDWKRASQTVGNRILRRNPNLLIFLSGLASSSRLRRVAESPAEVDIPNKLVYVAHDYNFWHPASANSYEKYREDVERNWGFIVQENQNWTAPLFVSEFGTCHDSLDCIYTPAPSKLTPLLPESLSHGEWFDYLIAYLKEIDVDFATWPWNGSRCNSRLGTFGDEEPYGISNVCWNGIFFKPYLERLQEIQPILKPR